MSVANACYTYKARSVDTNVYFVQWQTFAGATVQFRWQRLLVKRGGPPASTDSSVSFTEDIPIRVSTRQDNYTLISW